MATANITIKGAAWTAPVLDEEGAQIAPGFWTAQVSVDADDGHRMSNETLFLGEDATESDMLAALKTRWTTVRNMAPFVTTGKPQRLIEKFPRELMAKKA